MSTCAAGAATPPICPSRRPRRSARLCPNWTQPRKTPSPSAAAPLPPLPEGEARRSTAGPLPPLPVGAARASACPNWTQTERQSLSRLRRQLPLHKGALSGGAALWMSRRRDSLCLSSIRTSPPCRTCAFIAAGSSLTVLDTATRWRSRASGSGCRCRRFRGR